MQDVAGKTAFITGGASGMGLAMARSFAGAGMKVAIADIEKGALQTVQREFDETNASVITLQTDVADLGSMEEATAKTLDAFDKIHVLVNNAGVATGGPLASSEPNDWRWVMNVNLDGVYNGIHAILPRIIEQDEGGHVVNTASLAGMMAIPSLSIYAASKFAVLGLSECLHRELEDQNIGVSVLCPGLVNTNIFTSGRNRPDSLPGSTAAFENPASSGALEDLDVTQRNILEPVVVGDMVLHAVQNNRFYIFTHPNFAPIVQMRSALIGENMQYWQKYVEENL